MCFCLKFSLWCYSLSLSAMYFSLSLSLVAHIFRWNGEKLDSDPLFRLENFHFWRKVFRADKARTRDRERRGAEQKLSVWSKERKQKAFHATKLIAASSCCFRSRFCPPKSIILIDVTKNNANDNKPAAAATRQRWKRKAINEIR